MNLSGSYLRHWFLTLAQENLLQLFLVLASTASIIAQAVGSPSFSWWFLAAIAFLAAYFCVHLSRVTRLASQTYEAVPLPYSVCLAQSQDWHATAMREQVQTLEKAKIAWSDIHRTHRIDRSDWAYVSHDRLNLSSSSWRIQIADVVNHFDRLTKRVPIQPVFHFFFAVPAPIAFVLGGKIGRRKPMKVYQHAGMVRNPYAVVFSSENIDPEEGYHLLNRRVDSYNLIEFSSEPSEPKFDRDSPVLIVLDLTGHDLPRPYPEHEGKEIIYTSLRNSKGHIPLSEGWIDLAREIASLIFSFVDNDRAVHLLPGIPSALAFIVGTIVGLVPNVTLYHYNRHEQAYAQGLVLHKL